MGASALSWQRSACGMAERRNAIGGVAKPFRCTDRRSSRVVRRWDGQARQRDPANRRRSHAVSGAFAISCQCRVIPGGLTTEISFRVGGMPMDGNKRPAFRRTTTLVGII